MRRALAIAAIAAAGVGAGCGGDDETTTTPTVDTGVTGTMGASGATGATGADGAQGEPIDFEEARTSLEDAGFTVEDQAGEDLVQETGDGQIEASAGYRVFEPGSSADVVIQQFDSTEDAEAVAESLEVGFFAVETREDVVLFAVKDQEELLDEVSAATTD